MRVLQSCHAHGAAARLAGGEEVRLRANTDPQRDSLSPKDPSDVLDDATSEIAMGSEPEIDATKKLPSDGFKRPWPPLIRMSEEVRRKVDALFGK